MKRIVRIELKVGKEKKSFKQVTERTDEALVKHLAIILQRVVI